MQTQCSILLFRYLLYTMLTVSFNMQKIVVNIPLSVYLLNAVYTTNSSKYYSILNNERHRSNMPFFTFSPIANNVKIINISSVICHTINVRSN